MDTVSVVVEGSLIQQIGPDRICGMEHAGIGRIAESVSHRRHVVAAPHAGHEVLCHLFVNETTVNGQLAGCVVVNARDFFFQFIGNTYRRLKVVAVCGCREDSSVCAACGQQRLGVWIQHAGRDCIADERTTGSYIRGLGSARAIRIQNRWLHERSTCATCGIARRDDRRSRATEIAAIGGRIRHLLVNLRTINQPAPFHVIEKEELVLQTRNGAARVKAKNVVAELSFFLRWIIIKPVACLQGVVLEKLPS